MRKKPLILRLRTICGCERLIHNANPEWIETGLYVSINVSKPESPFISEHPIENCRRFKRVDRPDGSVEILPGGIVNFKEVVE